MGVGLDEKLRLPPLGETEKQQVQSTPELQIAEPNSDFENGSNAEVEGEPTVAPSTKSISFYLSMFMLGLMSLLIGWDATSLSVAIPVITNSLHGTTIQSFWATISFTLALVMTMPIYSNISDVVGRKPPLYFSLLLFAIGSVVFAVARTMPIAILGRILQGLGGSGIDILEAIVLADITTLKERPIYLGIMGVASAVGSIMGPILGAIFCEYVNWRWIGWVNLPIVGVILIIAIFCLKLKKLEMDFNTKIRRLDGIGMILFPIGAALVTLPLSWAGALYPWSSWKTIVPLIIGILVLVIFGIYELKPVEPMIPYRIFDNRTINSAFFSGAISGLLMYCVLQYLPSFFQAVFLQTPLQAAVSLLPILILFVGFRIISVISLKFTHGYRIQLWLAWILTTIIIGLWYIVNQETSKAVSATLQVFLGVGLGTTFTTTAIPIQASVTDINDQGIAAGMLVFLRFCGALLGLAICSTAFSSTFKSSIQSLGPLPEQLEILNDPSQAIAFIPKLRELELDKEVMAQLVQAYRRPFQVIFVVLTVVTGVGFLSSLGMREYDLEKEEVGRQGFEEGS